MWYSTEGKEEIALINQGYRLLAEYNLVKEELKNIYAIPSYASGLCWFGVIFVHGGIYAGSVFRFSIVLPDNFPEDVILPTVVFSSVVIHPHVCPETNTLDLSPFFKEWRKDQHHIWHILRYIQAIFADPEGSLCTGPAGDLVVMDEVVNMEALNLLAKSRTEYIKRVQERAIFSQLHIYDQPHTDDSHYIILEPYCPERHIKFMDHLNSPSWKEATSVDCSSPSEFLGHIDSSRELDEEEVTHLEKLQHGQNMESQREETVVS
ncbi:protein crossbronx-like [Drosophila rhopaloa]|uniref:Protein crossbronx-like n=1 Tax=Drosophila rhopaloa TaxID=1041015 RepID=A0A6P4FFQ2_DRORH|nr:protein crossbronx-like [Drosophila rhopaloa]XP_016986203.1 protein crossbronx-like [Drosophila rhopaloa]